MKKWILIMAATSFLGSREGAAQYLLAGTYDTDQSKGIHVYRFDPASGKAEELSMIEASNPSFLAVSPDERFVYAVHENGKDGKGGTISAYSFDKENGKLSYINTQSTEGDHPCFVEVDKTGKWIFAGNYSTGNFCMYEVDSAGGLKAAQLTIKHQGSGADKERQDGPHVHSTNISPDNKFLYVPDLGIDKVMLYAFDANSGELKPAPAVAAESRPASGPRHLAFHPGKNWLYLIEELSGTVVTYSFEGDKFHELQRISSTDPKKKGSAGSADIHVSPDGQFLYASNRGDFNDIVIYKIDEKKGSLKTVGFQSTLGKGPRNFTIDASGKYLLVANQGANEVVIFKRDTATGKLTDSGERINVGKPVCLKWIGK